ncbi:putative DnaJ domain, Chaperone J-domain superfamily [Helianthus debilis subsp. tardiflorus]
MECNKDEAHRAKKIAEEKVVKNDFEGARKIALKAKQLFPELDNISQLVTVCDVHCAAQKKIYGAEKDLYAILQVENVADDTTICKQYRKLALVLHPDKNKFPGAESAFKLIGEANMTLSDKGKRSIYDMRCREPAKASATKIHNHQGNQTSYAGQQNKFKSAPSSQFNGVSRGQQSTSNPSTRLTFWTYCPFCSFKYQYYREFIEGLLQCQQCSKLFIAYEIGPHAHNVNLGSKAQSVNPGSKPVSQQKEAAKVENAKGNIKKDGKVPSNLEPKKTEGTRMKQEGVTKSKVSGVRKPMETGTAKATDKKWRKRMAAESSEASSDKKEAAGGGVIGGSPNGKRSSRQRQQASYQEGGAGEFSPLKRSKLSKSSGDVAHNVNLGSKPVSQQKEAAKVENAKGNIEKDGKVPSNLERKKTEGTRMKQEGVTKSKVSGVRKPMETGTAKATDKKWRKRMAAESSEASSDKKEAAGGRVSGGSPNGKRSSRQRQQASYHKDSKVTRNRNKDNKQVLVQRQHRKGSKLTWELEDEMHAHYPTLFGLKKKGQVPGNNKGLKIEVKLPLNWSLFARDEHTL